MNNSPRFSRVFAALSLLLATGQPALAQVRVQIGNAGSGVPAIAPIGASSLNGAGSLSGALNSTLGLNGALSAPAIAPTPVVSAVPGAALTPALNASLSAPAKAGEAVVIRTPGGAATGVATEASFYAEEVVPAKPAAVSAASKTVDQPKKGLVARALSLVGLSAPSISFDGERKAPPLTARTGLREQKPLNLPNGSTVDEQPTTPSPDRETVTRVEAYGLPGARDVGGIFETSRKSLDANPSDAGAVVAAIKAAIDADPARYGVSSSDLRLIHAQAFEAKAGVGAGLFVYFRQLKNGLLVHGSSLSFTVKTIDGRPTIVAQTGQIFPALDANTEATMTDDQIMDAISQRTGMPAQEAASTFEFFEQKLVYSRGQWRNVKLYVAEGLPFMVAVDLASGLVFAWDNRTGLDAGEPAKPAAGGVTGKTVGNAVDKGPILKDSAISELGLPFLEVKVGGKSYITDKDGNLPADFASEIGTEGLELTATLAGPWVRVENQNGKTISVSVKVNAGDNKVVFNPNATLADENTLAQINAYVKVNLSLAFLRDRKLTNERMDKIQLPVRTNINDECNAYYTPGRPTLNFFRSSKNCVNSAYDTVAEHENGHYWDDFTGGIVNGGMSEGWGDILSMFRLNNPIIGEHFLKQARGGVDYIRHGENTYQYNEYDEVHDQGQAWGGFAWKLRKALIAKLGYEAGAEAAEALVLPTMFAKASSIPDAMAQVLVNATTSGGEILHEAEIRAAAKAHGVTLPTSAAPTGPAAWSEIKVKSSSIEPITGASEGAAPEAAGADAILPTHAEEAGQAKGFVTFSVGRDIRADAREYVRKYLDHFGVQYTLTRTSGARGASSYRLEMAGNARAIENLIKTLRDGKLGR